MAGCEPWVPDPQTITWSSRSSQLLCQTSFGGRHVVDVNHGGALAAAPKLSFALKPVIHPRVAVVKMCSSLQSLELTRLFLKANPFTSFPVPLPLVTLPCFHSFIWFCKFVEQQD